MRIWRVPPRRVGISQLQQEAVRLNRINPVKPLLYRLRRVLKLKKPTDPAGFFNLPTFECYLCQSILAGLSFSEMSKTGYGEIAIVVNDRPGRVFF